MARATLASVLVLLLGLFAAAAPGLGQTQPQAATPTIKRVNPEYPEKAHRKRIQGTVVLHALINKEGDIIDLTTFSGDPLLTKAAIKAVKQWKYRPYLFQGKPVEIDAEIQVNFTLPGG